MYSITRKILFLALLSFLSLDISAQLSSDDISPNINSPLSRFGLGNPVDRFFAASAGMGGWSAAYNDYFQLNLVNPASLAHLQATSFEVGLSGQFSQLKSATDSDNLGTGNLNYIALGFPLFNSINRALDRQSNELGLGMAFSLAPTHRVGYDLDLETIEPGVDLVSNDLKGQGGTYEVQWSNSVRYKDFSFGVNLGYNFGKITNSRRVDFDSLAVSFDSEFSDEFSIAGLTLDFGVQYSYDFKEVNDEGELVSNGKRLVVGVYGSPSASINTNSNRYYRRFFPGLSAATADTIQFFTDVRGDARLPGRLGFGVSYENLNKFRIGIDYETTAWSNYENDAKQESLLNSYRIAGGIEYIPNAASYNKYWSKVRYRLGFNYATDPRSLEGEQVSQYALTAGMGLPIVMARGQVSFLNLGFEYGRLGVPDVLTENYFRINLGFTLNDNTWFFKRKFN